MTSATIKSSGGLTSAMKLTISLLLVFVALSALFHFSTDGIFFSPRNLSLLLRQASIVAVLASGVCLLMIMREIDLSIGSAVFLCGVTAAVLNVTYQLPVLVCVLAAVTLGGFLGALQGALVVGLAIPSFIVTLAGLLGFRGIGLLWTNAATIAPVDMAFVKLSEAFISPSFSYGILVAILILALLSFVKRYRSAAFPGASARTLVVPLLALVAALLTIAWIVGGFRGIPMTVVWAACTGAILWFLSSRTGFGRNGYLIGANREAAEFAGISIKRHVFAGFAVMGLLYGVGGVLLTARLAASTPGAGLNLELDAIAAAVIGGTALSGGIGMVPGAIMGALLLATIDNGMSLMNVSSSAQLVVKSFVLLSALGINSYMVKRR